MENIGFFRGTTLMQTSGNIGGARSVFVKLKGIKNDLVYPTFGGMLMNPPKGNGFKFYATCSTLISMKKDTILFFICSRLTRFLA